MANDLAALLARYYHYYSQPSSVEDLANQYGYDKESLATLHRNSVGGDTPAWNDQQPSQWAQMHPNLARMLRAALFASSVPLPFGVGGGHAEDMAATFQYGYPFGPARNPAPAPSDPSPYVSTVARPSAPSARSALDDIIARAEATSRMRNNSDKP